MEEEKNQEQVAMGEEKEDKSVNPDDFSSEDVKFTKIDADEEQAELKAKANYNGADIQVLKGLEPVRERPGMYIGTTSAKGLHHLIREIVDNSVDEALAGYCHNIHITLEKDGSVTVEDDGRGIPCDIVPSTGLSGVETVYTILHAGGKFEGSNGYKVSGGLHGVGASVVNALSTHVRVTVYKEGKIHQIDFENGGHTVAPGIKIVGDCDINKTGTTVNFMPDASIFKETTVFNYQEVRESIRQTAYLNKGLSLTLTDLREEEPVQDVYCFNGGISEFVSFLNAGKPIIFPDIIYFDGKSEDGVFAECAFQPTKTSVFTMKSFCNNIRTAGGGTHEEGFRLAFGREMNKYFRNKEWVKDGDDPFTYDDLVEGLTVVISVKHPDPQYEGQVKDKLGNAEVRKDVSSIVGDQLATWLSENPKLGRIMYERVLTAYKGRKAAERARNQVVGKGAFGGIPDKLADCISKNPEERELFIVEGNSAGGSAKNGRDAFTQAILPLRGKILNIEKAAATRIEKNAEIENMIQAIGAGYGESFDITKIKYHKVIIMTDADVDGSHIRILLLTFFYRYMKPLVEGGYIYIAQPPLYKLTYQGHDYYCFKEEELQPLKDKLPKNARFALQRYKGLGEMDASQLAETTMEKTRRKMWKVSVTDAEEADNALTDLMGENVVPRKDFITANAKFVKNLDIN
jgi:DNA gyrase subunit B